MKKNKKIKETETETDTMTKAKKLANQLYKAYSQQQETGCGELLLYWTKEVFWGKVAKTHLPIFAELWKILDKNNYTKDKPISLGDLDYSVWVEYPRAENKKVIVSKCHCSCADNSTTLFIMDNDFSGNPKYGKFVITTAWPKEKKCKMLGNVEQPSLKTYLDNDFATNKEAGRVMLYEAFTSRVLHANWKETEIARSLDELKWLLSEVKEEIEGSR
jgi:hypothetical protein